MDEGSIQQCDIGRDAGIPEGPETESRITIRGMDSYLRNFITLKQKKIELQEHPGNVKAAVLMKPMTKKTPEVSIEKLKGPVCRPSIDNT